MISRPTLNGLIGGLLVLGAIAFVGLLSGIGSAQLTEDPPEISPYQSSGSGSAGYPLPAAGTDTSSPAEPADVQVTIENFAFGPETVTIAPGTKVTFVNDETGVTHTTTSVDGAWDSGSLQPGESFSFTADSAGVFGYFCTIHPSMTAEIVVRG